MADFKARFADTKALRPEFSDEKEFSAVMDEGTADFEANHTEDDVEFFPSFAGDKKSAFRAEMGETQVVYVGAEKYTGEYVVAPDFVGKTLETAHKLMDENITVKPILVSKVSNHAGGNTIYIGGDIAYGKPVQQ